MLLLTAALYIGFLFRYRGVFPEDEGDKLAIGLLISRGGALYRDLFSHHMPFPYLWTAVVLWLSPTIKAVRLSVWAYQVLAFGAVMGITRRYVGAGVAALAWAAIGHLFYANMALYNVFSGAALAVVLAATLTCLLRNQPPGWLSQVAWGIAAAIAVLSDPLAVLPVLVSVAALAASRRSRAYLRLPLGMMLAGFILLGLYLLATGSLAAFYQDVVVFNTQVYSRYYQIGLPPLRVLAGLLFGGLGVLDPYQWYIAVILTRIPWLPGWEGVAAGCLVFRLAVLAACVLLLRRRQWLAAATVYLFATVTLLRADGPFRMVPFMFTSLLCASWVLFDLPNGVANPDTAASASPHPDPGNGVPVQGKSAGVLRAAQIAMQAVLAGTFIFLAAGTYVYFQPRQNLLSYFDAFGSYEPVGEEIRGLACGEPAELGFYPGDPLVYFTSGLPPVAGYVYLWPWVYEYGGQAILNRLGEPGEKAIVYVAKERVIWGYPATSYLANLIAFLNAHYIQAGPYYISPSLAATCPPVLTGALTR